LALFVAVKGLIFLSINTFGLNVMVVASFTLAAGTLISFVMANAVVAARGFLLPYVCKKDHQSNLQSQVDSSSSKIRHEDFLITSS